MTKEAIKFTIVKGDYGLVAHLYDANGKSWYPSDTPEDAESPEFAGGQYDDCVIGGWQFPAALNLDTPRKIAMHLMRNGAVWDKMAQAREEPELFADLSMLMSSLKPTKKKVQHPKR